MNDVTVIGGGIVGLATAYQVTQRFPSWSVAVVEKEPQVGLHQTGRNSGVLHSGIYYKPGSLKATNCQDGRVAMARFCQDNAIAFDICGKVIVAVDDSELAALDKIYSRGQANGVRCEKLSAKQLTELEPHVSGVAGIHVPETGIINYDHVCECLVRLVQEASGRVMTQTGVDRMERRPDSLVLHTTQGAIETRYAINCAGLQSDRVTKMSGQTPDAKIIPFRGEYYKLKPEAHHLCKNLIYPVPNPEFPFLGVHFTRMIDGGVECGPNAVLALAREGYRWRDISLRDSLETFCYPAFYKMAAQYWRIGMGEIHRSLRKSAFVTALQRLVPEIKADHLVAAPAGVRAQAVAPDGRLVDDFLIHESDRIVNVANAPSPAATSALNIGALIVERLAGMQK